MRVRFRCVDGVRQVFYVRSDSLDRLRCKYSDVEVLD